MSLIKKSVSLSIDSAYGTNVTNDGGTFSYTLTPPMAIPRSAVDCNISCPEANIVYTIPNLSVSSTDKFSYRYKGVQYTHDIPEGIYGLSDVEDFMNRSALSDGISLAQDLFTLEGIDSTQRVAIGVYISDADGALTISFGDTGASALASLLGFEATNLVFAATVPGAVLYQTAPNRATFSDLQYIDIVTDFISSGYSQSGSPNQSIATVTPDVSVGSTILYRPRNPIILDARNLIGGNVGRMNFSLVSNTGEKVGLMGETWSMRIVVEYFIRV